MFISLIFNSQVFEQEGFKPVITDHSSVSLQVTCTTFILKKKKNHTTFSLCPSLFFLSLSLTPDFLFHNSFSLCSIFCFRQLINLGKSAAVFQIIKKQQQHTNKQNKKQPVPLYSHLFWWMCVCVNSGARGCVCDDVSWHSNLPAYVSETSLSELTSNESWVHRLISCQRGNNRILSVCVSVYVPVYVPVYVL